MCFCSALYKNEKAAWNHCSEPSFLVGLVSGESQKSGTPLKNTSKQVTTDGVPVDNDEHQIICGGDIEHFSASSHDSSDKKPISTTDGVYSSQTTSTASVHTNSEQVIQQEWSNPCCSRICTGLQHLPLPATYQPRNNSLLFFVDHNVSMLKLLPLSISDTEYEQHRCNDDQQVIQLPKGAEKPPEELWQCASMERGPLYYTKIHIFQRCGIQETQQWSGNQQPVFNNSTKFWQCSNTSKNTYNTHTERCALERPELYTKPFIALMPE